MPKYDNAPIGNTCPDIDRIIGVIEAVADRLYALSGQVEDVTLSEDLRNQSDNLQELFKTVRSPMEDLRKANSSLRDWGNEEYKRAEEAEDKAAGLQNRIDELENT